MAISPIALKGKEKKGGGLLGSVIGGLASTIGGIAAAPFTGGASLAVVPVGAPVGGAVGGVVSKPGFKAPGGPTPLENAAKMDPGVAIAQLNEAEKLLERDLSLPADEMTNYRRHFGQARQVLTERYT